ncbi:hypothetical protein O181_027857 [Austropuccinia psidii MF-1]|uniref:Retrotransposon gag domain-containing protein n=1 Tax=Austropuccinia psidii MF-1 TaxID=1389203 RepID=A0A9Q3H228_9BASI|nr:hypothetical protein [Austropuccinia psidii MF-1]
MSEGARARLGEAEDEEEDSEEAVVATALEGGPEASEAANPAHSNQPLVSQAEPSFRKMLEQMTQFMGKLTQAFAPRDNSKSPAFKTPSMKEPDSFDENFISDRKKVLYSTPFLTGRAGKWIEPYLSNILNEDPSYLLNNWQLFETQLFALIGDTNKVRNAEQELDNFRMKKSGHVSLYIADLRSLMSRIGDWGERAYINVYRRGLASRPLDQLASYPDTRYHERQKEKGSHQEKKHPVTGSNSSRPPQDPSSKRPHHKKNKKGKQFQASNDKPHSALLYKNNKLIGSEKERSLKEGLCTYCGGKHPIENCFKRPHKKPG